MWIRFPSIQLLINKATKKDLLWQIEANRVNLFLSAVSHCSFTNCLIIQGVTSAKGFIHMLASLELLYWPIGNRFLSMASEKILFLFQKIQTSKLVRENIFPSFIRILCYIHNNGRYFSQ